MGDLLELMYMKQCPSFSWMISKCILKVEHGGFHQVGYK